MICGIWAEEAYEFHPSQWVNVYNISPLGAVFCYSCQVKDLNINELEGYDYGIEPTDEDGNVMTVEEAMEIVAA